MSIVNSPRMPILLLRNSPPSRKSLYSVLPAYQFFAPIRYGGLSLPRRALTSELPLFRYFNSRVPSDVPFLPPPQYRSTASLLSARILTLCPLYRLSLGRISPILSAYLFFFLYWPPGYPTPLYYLSIYHIRHVLSF